MKNLFLGIATCCGVFTSTCDGAQKKIANIADALSLSRANNLSEEKMRDVLIRSASVLRRVENGRASDVSYKSFLRVYELLLGKHIECLKKVWLCDASSRQSVSYVFSFLKTCLDENRITISLFETPDFSSIDTAQTILVNESYLSDAMDNIISFQMKKQNYPNMSYWISEYKRDNWGIL